MACGWAFLKKGLEWLILVLHILFYSLIELNLFFSSSTILHEKVILSLTKVVSSLMVSQWVTFWFVSPEFKWLWLLAENISSM